MNDWQSALTVAGLCFGSIGALGTYLQYREANDLRERLRSAMRGHNDLLDKLTRADHDADMMRTIAADRLKMLDDANCDIRRLNSPIDPVGFGTRLQALRTRNGMTRKQFADSIGETGRWRMELIYRLETGKAEPTINRLAAIQAQYPDSFAWLMTGAEV